jgi:hypothetical protein
MISFTCAARGIDPDRESSSSSRARLHEGKNASHRCCLIDCEHFEWYRR